MRTKDFYDPTWHIPHYYGDVVRRLFLGCAALMLFTAPMYGINVSAELPYELAAAVLLAVLAALTGPRILWVMLADTIVAGIGFIIFEMWAVTNYDTITPVAFVLREAIALCMLFALYNAAKTARAMIIGQVGIDVVDDEYGQSALKDADDYKANIEFGDPGGIDGTSDDGM